MSNTRKKPAKPKAKSKTRARASKKAKPETAAAIAPAAPPEPQSNPGIVREQKEAARILGVTDRSLRDWMKKPGFPEWSAGYDIQAIRDWVHEMRLKGSIDSEADESIRRQLELEKLEQEKIKTQQARYKLAVQEGELLPRRSWELFVATLLTSLGDWCEQLPDLMANVCSDDCREAVQHRLEQELNDRRQDLREEFDRKAAELAELAAQMEAVE